MRSSKRAARAAAVLGALAVLAIPAGIAASRLLNGVTLLRSLYVSVAAACIFGLLAVACGRRARFAVARSVRPDVETSARLGRVLAWTGLYVGLTGALALAVYGVLRWAQ